MLTVSGNHKFYFIPGVTDMRFGYHKLLQIIKNSYHMNPMDGSAFVFMSKESSVFFDGPILEYEQRSVSFSCPFSFQAE